MKHKNTVSMLYLANSQQFSHSVMTKRPTAEHANYTTRNFITWSFEPSLSDRSLEQVDLSPEGTTVHHSRQPAQHVFIRTKTKLHSAPVTSLTLLNPFLSPPSAPHHLPPTPSLSLRPEVNPALRPCSHCASSATSVWGLCVPLIIRGAMLSPRSVPMSVCLPCPHYVAALGGRHGKFSAAPYASLRPPSLSCPSHLPPSGESSSSQTYSAGFLKQNCTCFRLRQNINKPSIYMTNEILKTY